MNQEWKRDGEENAHIKYIFKNYVLLRKFSCFTNNYDILKSENQAFIMSILDSLLHLSKLNQYTFIIQLTVNRN